MLVLFMASRERYKSYKLHAIWNYCRMDIEDKHLLQNYLSDTHNISISDSDGYQILRGGVSNKAILYSGKAGNWVIKQGLSKLRVKADWFSSPARLKIEAKAIQWLGAFLPEHAVPDLIFFDEEHYILAMEAVPMPHENFKTILLSGALDTDYVCQMAYLLAAIHNKGVDNDEAKSLFIDRSFFKNLRIEPYYEYTASQIPESKAFFNDLIQDSMKIKKTVVHGDYSPKNILVRKEKLVLLDHEVMHWGDPTFDVGFALCHFLSKANYFGDKKYINAALKFWNEYNKHYTHQDEAFENRATRQLMGCLLARVKGRSPLEYLSEEKGRDQVNIVIESIRNKVFSMDDFVQSFGDRIITNK